MRPKRTDDDIEHAARVERIARNAFHMHEMGSRWDDLHSTDQQDYLGFAYWVLESVTREKA